MQSLDMALLSCYRKKHTDEFAQLSFSSYGKLFVKKLKQGKYLTSLFLLDGIVAKAATSWYILD